MVKSLQMILHISQDALGQLTYWILNKISGDVFKYISFNEMPLKRGALECVCKCLIGDRS